MISPLLMLAPDSDLCPTSVPSPVAPLNTYTFLKELTLFCKIPGIRIAINAVGELGVGSAKRAAAASRQASERFHEERTAAPFDLGTGGG